MDAKNGPNFFQLIKGKPWNERHMDMRDVISVDSAVNFSGRP
jgi:hypothetical protein